jgi:hypothetical protein
MGAVGVLTVQALMAQSNLWPLMFILSAPVAILWLGLAALVRARVAA